MNCTGSLFELRGLRSEVGLSRFIPSLLWLLLPYFFFSCSSASVWHGILIINEEEGGKEKHHGRKAWHMVKTEVETVPQSLAIERTACQSYKKDTINGSRGEEGWLTVPRLFPKQVRTLSQIKLLSTWKVFLHGGLCWQVRTLVRRHRSWVNNRCIFTTVTRLLTWLL